MGCNTSQDLKKTCENVSADDGGGDSNFDTQKNNSAKNVPSSINGDNANKDDIQTNIKEKTIQPNQKEEKLCDKAKLDEFDDNEEEFGDDEEKAATKIQAVFRGHKVRTTMKKSDDTTQTSQEPTNSNGESSDPTKEELEAEFDPNDKELCDAAMKIQATFRGHLQRKIVNKENEDVDIEEITKKVAEELDIDLTDPELNKAATKIQASFRGHKLRKDVTTN